MENNYRLSFSKIKNVAATEYVKWICNPRMIILLCMLIYIYDYIILEMKGASADMGSTCSVFEPFLAIGNSALLLLLLPIIFITLLGDFPKTDGNTMFYICRTGKQNWIFGQILFVIMAEITYLVSVFVFSVLFSLTFSNVSWKWSDAVTKYVYKYPERRGSLMANLLTNRLYNNLELGKTMFYTTTLMFLNLLFIAMVLLVGFAIGKRMVGIVAGCVILCVGTTLSVTDSNIKWLFPTANATCWMHYDNYLNKQIYDIRFSYIYYFLMIVSLIIIAVSMIEHYDFSKVTDMED